jgi:predicted nucleic acid-binding protein
MGMVLVDTSVWISHLRDGNAEMERLLYNARVMCHPFITGEIACGNLKNLTEVLLLLKNLPQAAQVEHREVLYFIEQHGLMGKGLGYVDMHIAASAVIAGIPIWTFDKRLSLINKTLGIVYPDPNSDDDSDDETAAE